MSSDKFIKGMKGSTFIGAVVAATLVLLSPVAFFVSGSSGVLAVLISTVVCGVPGLLCFAFREAWARSSTGLLVLSFVRMGLGMAMAVIAKMNRPDLTFANFFVWLAVVYMVCLAADTFAVQRLGVAQESEGVC